MEAYQSSVAIPKEQAFPLQRDAINYIFYNGLLIEKSI